jgi:hypothetical protein
MLENGTLAAAGALLLLLLEGALLLLELLLLPHAATPTISAPTIASVNGPLMIISLLPRL